MSKETVIVQLSAQDRTLLRRIADALDPVTAPQSGPRRLREPNDPDTRLTVWETDPVEFELTSEAKRRLRDKHVALTAEDSKRIAEDSV